MIWKLFLAMLILSTTPTDTAIRIRPSVEEALYSRPDLAMTQLIKELPDRTLPVNPRPTDMEKLVDEFMAIVQHGYPSGRQNLTVALDGLKQLRDRFDKVIYYEIRETPSASTGSGAAKQVSALPKLVDEHGLSTKKPYSVLPLLQGGYRCNVLTIKYSEDDKKWLFYDPQSHQKIAATTCKAITPEKWIVMVSCSADQAHVSEQDRQELAKRLESAFNDEIEILSRDRYPNVTTAAQQEKEFYRTSSPMTQAAYAREYHFVLKIKII